MNKKRPVKKLCKSTYNKKDWEWPQDADKGGKQWPKETRLLYILSLFDRGILDPNKQQLAEKMGVHRNSITTDFKEVYRRGVDPDEANQAKVQIAKALKNAVIEASSAVLTRKGKEQLQAITVLGSISKDYTDILERFDIKKPGEIDRSDNELIVRWETAEERKKKGG